MKIVHITSSLDGGGIASLLLEYCSRMVKEINFDFILTSDKKGILENKFEEMGCKIYHIPQLRKNPYKSIKALYKILKENKYDILHAHGDYKCFDSLLIAKMIGIKNRIVHSHLAYTQETIKQKIERKVFVPLVKFLSTQLMACSKDAAIWMWGDTDNKKIIIMPNAIDTKKFLYNDIKRKLLRKKYNIEDCFVIGNVARFSYQKDHEFLLEIFKDVLKQNQKAILLLIGDGELKDEILNKIKKLKIDKNVILLGTIDNVNEYLNVMDVFVLPTRYEGLGIVYVEAQANGMKCFGSKDVVPEEANVCNNLIFISKNSSPEEWAKEIRNINFRRDENVLEKISNAGYDIELSSKNIKEFYLSL